MNRLETSAALAAMLLALGATPSASAAKLYRWVDEQGQVHYGYTIPPQYAKQGSEELSKSGRTVKSTPRAKTAEEIAADEAETKQRAAEEAEAQRRAEEQQRYDEILLRSYSSVGEIESVRDRTLGSIDASIELAKGRIEKLSGDLDTQRKEAARLERSGKATPAHVTQAIERLSKQITENEVFVEQQQHERAALEQKYADEIARYRELRPGQ